MVNKLHWNKQAYCKKFKIKVMANSQFIYFTLKYTHAHTHIYNVT